MSAIRARHFVARGRFGLGRWRVREFHVHTLPKVTSRTEFVKQRDGTKSSLSRVERRAEDCPPYPVGACHAGGSPWRVRPVRPPVIDCSQQFAELHTEKFAIGHDAIANS